MLFLESEGGEAFWEGLDLELQGTNPGLRELSK
jgi:hypothetical protein